MAIKVFFNDSCSICRLEINHYKKIADSNLEWVDITNNEEALKLTSKSQEELLICILHVIKPKMQSMPCPPNSWQLAIQGITREAAMASRLLKL